MIKRVFTVIFDVKSSRVLLNRNTRSCSDSNNNSKMSVKVDLSAMRQPYHDDESVLLEENLPTRNPILLFKEWFEVAKNTKTIYEPNAVCLATSTKDGYPSSRMVLLKGFGDDGFTVFTNLSSRKGKELLENPKAALLFYWDPLKRQVRIEGSVEKLPEADSKHYFENRPKRSQIAAAISSQSEPIESREELIRRYIQLEEKHANDKYISKPEDWGGFRIVPKSFEFWQGQSSRLHDRLIFRPAAECSVDGKLVKPAEGGWVLMRLQP